LKVYIIKNSSALVCTAKLIYDFFKAETLSVCDSGCFSKFVLVDVFCCQMHAVHLPYFWPRFGPYSGHGQICGVGWPE